MISILEELKIILDIAEGNDSQELLNLQEKITTKQALRKKRRRARKLRQKMAQQSQQTQEPQQEDPTDVQNTDVTNLDGKIEENTSIVVYDEDVATKMQHSQQFLTIMEALTVLAQTWGQQWDAVCNKFRSLGDKGVTQEIIDEFTNLLDDLGKQTKQLVDNKVTPAKNELYVEEVEYLSNVFEALNSGIEKYQKAVDMLHAEDLLDDQQLDALEDKLDQQLPALTTGGEVTTTEEPEEEEDDGSRKETDLITYDMWAGGVETPNQIWMQVRHSLDEVKKMPFTQFVTTCAKGLAGWFGDQITKLITSPVVKDAFKTLFYSNPITAMIWDGDFGKFNPIEDLFKGIKTLASTMKKEEESQDKLNKYGLPEDVSKWKLNKLRAFYYGNKNFVDLVNLCYNHIEVDLQDKKALYQNTKTATTQFEGADPKRDLIVKCITEIIQYLVKICEYQRWNSTTIIEKVLTNYNKKHYKLGNTQKQIDKITDKTKEQEQEEQAKNNANALQQMGLMNDKGVLDQDKVDAFLGVLNGKKD